MRPGLQRRPGEEGSLRGGEAKRATRDRRAPRTALDFPIDSPRAGTIIRGVYGPERNADGPFVWMRPGGAISVPLDAPGSHRLSLRLQGRPLVASPRVIALNSGDTAATSTTVATAPGLYSHARSVRSVPGGGAGDS